MATDVASERQVAVLIDFENVGLGSVRWLFDQVSDFGRIIVRRAYADWSTTSSKGNQRGVRDQLLELGIEPIHLFHSASGKNSSDIRLTIDAVDLMYQTPVDTFVIVSSDTDFVPLVSKLRAAGKTVIGAGRKATVSRTLVTSCDRYFYLDQPERPSGETRQGETQVSLEPDIDSLLVRAVKVAMDDQGRMVGSKLRDTLQRLDPSFNYRAMGFSTFTKYLDASDEVIVNRPKGGESDVTVELAESPDPEVMGTRIDAAWAKRSPMSGQSFDGTTAANDVAKVLGVSKLSDSPYKTLQGLLDAISHLNTRWVRRRNRIIRR